MNDGLTFSRCDALVGSFHESLVYELAGLFDHVHYLVEVAVLVFGDAQCFWYAAGAQCWRLLGGNWVAAGRLGILAAHVTCRDVGAAMAVVAVADWGMGRLVPGGVATARVVQETVGR